MYKCCYIHSIDSPHNVSICKKLHEGCVNFPTSKSSVSLLYSNHDHVCSHPHAFKCVHAAALSTYRKSLKRVVSEDHVRLVSVQARQQRVNDDIYACNMCA